jgi:nucleoside-diphosphate-sugar epimerase
MITILGATGFVGSTIKEQLSKKGEIFFAPARNEDLSDKDLGNVIYCIGLTADFRSRPFDTVEAHICKLKEILKYSRFDSLTYLSSTRVYIHSQATHENAKLVIDPSDPNDLYNTSKLAGEFLALNSGLNNIKVARLSNVFGDDIDSENFITSVVKDAILKKHIVLRTTPDSAKDYIDVNDVARLLVQIAKEKKSGVYNIASGFNTTNHEILISLQKITGCKVEYLDNAQKIVFPRIDNDKIKQQFHYSPSKSITASLSGIVNSFHSKLIRDDFKS